MKPALLITWTESEAGWGQRPDGASLHLSQEDVTAYIKDYWDREKELNPSGATPHEYSRPDGDRGRLVLVDDNIYEKIKASTNGVLVWQTEYSKMRSEKRIVTDIGSRQEAATVEPEAAFVGIVERNDWEGEVFGYYWDRTPEAEEALAGILKRYEAEGDISMRLELATEERLRELDDADRNGYRKRITIYEPPDDWSSFVKKLAPDAQKITDDDVHPFYKGRGLPTEMERPRWRE
jgi:hypothetical protein